MENRKQQDAQTLADIRLPEDWVKQVEEEARRKEEEQSSEDSAAGTTPSARSE